MSRLSNVEAKDSLLVKVKSGIQACFQMDIMKDMPSFLIPDAGDNGYLYTLQGVTFIDDRCVNVIHFAQKKEIIEPLYCGDLYIDAETNALLQARFEVDPHAWHSDNTAKGGLYYFLQTMARYLLYSSYPWRPFFQGETATVAVC